MWREFGAFALFILFSGLMMSMGAALANKSTNDWWRDELTKRGHAQYNQTTGAWEWRDSGKGGWE